MTSTDIVSERPRRARSRKVSQGDTLPAGALRRESPLERDALNRIAQAGLPAPVREHHFAPPRKWAFDLAYLAEMVAVELEGGTWTNGRHTRGKGFDADCRKYGEATARGWLVLRCTAEMIADGTMVALLRRLLA